MKQGKQDEKARMRSEMIMKVQSELLTATAAARELGISRKTFYEWQKKGLEGMVTALTDTPAGRPSAPSDLEKEDLKRELAETKRELELVKTRMQIQEFMTDSPDPRKGAGPGRPKKKRPRSIERKKKHESEGDSGGGEGMQGEDRDAVSDNMPRDSAPVFECAAMACEDAARSRTSASAGTEKSGAG